MKNRKIIFIILLALEIAYTYLAIKEKHISFMDTQEIAFYYTYWDI